MAKPRTTFVCSACGHETQKWFGRCPGCDAWNTMEETAPKTDDAPARKPNKQRGGQGGEALRMRDIEAQAQSHRPSGIGEFDRVLGGGLVDGSVLLVGGEPGVGKSTLLLQVCAELSRAGKRVLYVSGEESARQIKLRAVRLGADKTDMLVLGENAVDQIEEKLAAVQPDFAVIDSIQTMYRPDMASAPGSVSQVRESAASFMRYAKENGCTVVLVGHVTKEGAIAGPRILEHLVDVVLYFEGDYQREYRILRAVKNRFGSVNELGIFEMAGDGMRAVENASETLLSLRLKGASGSAVFCGMEGTRPVLMDIQALATTSYLTSPRRACNGVEQGRAALLLAVLEKRAGFRLYNQDVYLNVAGGLSLTEPAADLPVCLAVCSSLRDIPLPPEMAAIGEIGLSGEVRPVPHMDRRLRECARLGFTRVMCPRGGQFDTPDGMTLVRVETIAQAVAVFRG